MAYTVYTSIVVCIDNIKFSSSSSGARIGLFYLVQPTEGSFIWSGRLKHI